MDMAACFEEAGRFIESQLLDMRWLDEPAAMLLLRGGIDPATPLGTTSQFIVCSIVRSTLLLIVLSVLRCISNRYFAPERSRRALFGGGISAALTGAAAGASLPRSAETALPSRLAALVGRGMAPEAATALLFGTQFADPFTSLVLLTMAFGARNALLCTLSAGFLAVLGGMLAGQLWRQDRRTGSEVSAPTSDPPAPVDKPPRLRDFPDRVLAEIRYIFPYIVLGAGAGAFIRSWVPESWIRPLIGTADPLAVCLAVIAGIPLGADLFVMLPIVVELQVKGAHPGVLTAFVLSATCFTPSALFAFKRAVKPKLLLLIYALCLIRAAGIGCLSELLPEWFR